jgi:hypothetical protein
LEFTKIEIASHISAYSRIDFEKLGHDWDPIWSSIRGLQKSVNSGEIVVEGCEFDPQYDHFPGGKLPYCIEMQIDSTAVGEGVMTIYLLGNVEPPAIFDLVLVSTKPVAVNRNS